LLGQGWFAKGFMENIDKSKFVVINIYRYPFVNTPMLLQTIKPNTSNFLHNKCFTSLIDKSIQDEITTINLETKKIYTLTKSYTWAGGYLVCGLGSNTDAGRFWTDKIEHIKKLKPGSSLCIVGAGPTGTELAFHLSDLGFKPTLYDGLPSVYTFLTPESKSKIIEQLVVKSIPLHTSRMFVDSDRSKFDDIIFAIGSRPNDLTSKWKPTSQLTLESNPEVFVGGDGINTGLPKTAQVAYQQGVYVAQKLNKLEQAKNNNFDFKFVPKGTAIYIGKSWYLVELQFNGSSYTLTIPEKLIQLYYSWCK
jgi:NADH dehydrogenase FAD-containing subunit